MTYLFSATVSLILISSLACQNNGITYNCEGVKLIEGLPDFSHIDIYFPFSLTLYNNERVTYCNNEHESKIGVVNSENKKLRLDFGDADQEIFTIFNYTFEELLKSGKQSIEGIFEDGFWWTSGYNRKAKFEMVCTMKPNPEIQ